jgi:Tfp pilus assembly protein PilZ
MSESQPASDERRRHKRHLRQLAVEFGERELLDSGVTDDISAGGVFVTTERLPPLGARLHLRLFHGADCWLYFEVEVRRQRHTPPALRGTHKPGFGVRFLFPAALVAEVVGVNPPIVPLRFQTAGALASVYDVQLRFGRVALPAEQRLEPGREVLLALHLEFVERVFKFESTVTESGDGTSQRQLTVEDSSALRAALAPYVFPRSGT